MNISKILFIVLLIVPLSTVYAQNEDLIFEDAEITSREETPSPSSKFNCKTCDDYWVISDFDEGIRAVKNRNGKIGFINAQETLIIPLEYDGYEDIYENRIIVYKNRYKYGIIDFQNRIIIPFEYDSVGRISKDAYHVNKDSKRGIFDRDGKEVIPVEYEFISLIDNYYIIKKNGNSGVLDINGNTLLNPIYKSISKFISNYFICQAPENSNIINVITSQKLLKGNYDKLAFSQKKLLLANKKNKMGLINFSEEIFIPFDYDKITILSESLFY